MPASSGPSSNPKSLSSLGISRTSAVGVLGFACFSQVLGSRLLPARFQSILSPWVMLMIYWDGILSDVVIPSYTIHGGPAEDDAPFHRLPQCTFDLNWTFSPQATSVPIRAVAFVAQVDVGAPGVDSISSPGSNPLFAMLFQ